MDQPHLSGRRQWRPLMFGICLALCGIALVVYNFKWIRNVLARAAPVTAAELRKITDPEKLSRTYVAFTPTKIIDTGVTKWNGTRKSGWLCKFWLLQVEDRWLIASVPSDFTGSRVTGCLTIWSSLWGEDALREVRAAAGPNRDLLLPYQMSADRSEGVQVFSLLGIAAFLILGGLFYIAVSKPSDVARVLLWLMRWWRRWNPPAPTEATATASAAPAPTSSSPAMDRSPTQAPGPNHTGRQTAPINGAAQLPGALPPEVAGLGEPLHVHPPAEGRDFSDSMVGPVILSVAVGGFLMLIAVIGIVAQFNTGPKATTFSSYVIFGGFGLFGLGVALSGPVYAWWRAAQRAADPRAATKLAPITYYVYEDALVLSRQGEVIPLPWDDLTLYNQREWGGSYQVSDRSGRKFPIKDHVKDHQRLISTVLTRIGERVVPGWLAAIEAGQTVRIGPFSLTREAIGLHGDVLPWHSMSSICVVYTNQGTYLKIRKQGIPLIGSEWCNECTDTFAREANAFYFYDLLKSLVPPSLLVEGDPPCYLVRS